MAKFKISIFDSSFEKYFDTKKEAIEFMIEKSKYHYIMVPPCLSEKLEKFLEEDESRTVSDFPFPSGIWIGICNYSDEFKHNPYDMDGLINFKLTEIMDNTI